MVLDFDQILKFDLLKLKKGSLVVNVSRFVCSLVYEHRGGSGPLQKGFYSFMSSFVWCWFCVDLGFILGWRCWCLDCSQHLINENLQLLTTQTERITVLTESPPEPPMSTMMF